MAWQPENSALVQLAGFLKDSLSGHDPAAQKHASNMLAQARANPDINNYLAFLFTCRQPHPVLDLTPEQLLTARCAAAIMLKNDLRTDYEKVSEPSRNYIRSSVLLGLQDSSPQIRSFAGNVITEIVRAGGILGWPELLQELISLVGNATGNVPPATQEGAMGALVKVCEDNKKVLDRSYQGQRPLDHIIPKLIDFTGSQVPGVRALSISCLNSFIQHKPQAFMTSMDTFLGRLFSLASDSNDVVRRNVCRSFVMIVDTCPEKLAPHMEGLVTYMISQQQNRDDQELALDAAEFWLCVGEHEQLGPALRPYLNRVVPVLLESMVYSEDDILQLEGGGDDADEDDKEEDIRPQFAKSKGARAGVATDNNATAPANGVTDVNQMTVPEEDDLSDGEIEEFDDEDGDDPEDQWNLRKCSAAALDVLATLFQGAVFEVTLPYLMENLKHAEWPHREAALLALGAVGSGCMDDVTPHLPDLIPYMNSLLNDPEPMVRKITCWTLGRYSGWASHLENPADKARFFEPMMEGILMRMLDSNKKVQEAAASAFATVEEKSGQFLSPYCEPIVQQFVRCFAQYKDRNMFILYDCVQTLAEVVGPSLAKPQLVNLLMPALLERYNKVSDQSRQLFPLLECLSCMATALGAAFLPYAGPLFGRCIRIIHQNLQEYMAAVQNPGSLDQPDKDFLVTSLDLLSAVIQALGAKSGELVAASQPPFFELLAFCMEDANSDVRQSSYALLGDCAIYIPDKLQPVLPSIMPIVIKQLNLEEFIDEQIQTGFSVINNACWSCGEIAVKQRGAMAPYIEQLYQRLKAITINPQVPESVHENAAIALGRLGIGAPEKLAFHLSEFAEAFLDAIDQVDWTEEKDTAFVGFARVVEMNPQGMESCLRKYFEVVARYQVMLHPETGTSQALKPLFYQTLIRFKEMIPNFDGFLAQLAPSDSQALRQNYNL